MSNQDAIEISGFGQETPSFGAVLPAEAPKPDDEVTKPDDEAPETDDEAVKPDDEVETDDEAVKPELRKKLTAQDRIREINAKYRDEQRQNQELTSRLERLEQGLTQRSNYEIPEGPQKPSSSDYEFGSLDDRYIEDMIDWKAEQKTAEKFGEVSRRQLEQQAQAQTELQVRELQSKADEMALKGASLHKDYLETVVESAYRGDYPLEQATFEALALCDNGAAVLYALATNKAEAVKVSAMSPIQQAHYVFEKNAEMSKTAPRTTKASAPPSIMLRGSSSRNGTAPDTDDLDAFEKLYFTKKR